MEGEKIIYAIYTLFFLILVGSIVLTPLLAFDNDVNSIYKAFSYTCHQKLSRTLCVFKDVESLWIADCTPQTGDYTPGFDERREITVEMDGAIGYKMPVCSRDWGLYAAMLLGTLVYPIVREIKERKMLPPILLVIAIMPLAVDGGLQLISEMGFLPFIYESTNAIRLFTGIVAGFAASLYAIPTLINMFTKNR
ncbi:DUF2085 domain-containing protein [Candidatus Micrarchaeota archaeon]|nr:DUF2085 domain-containing protein [Candidatus Micrarchaeota archaeon]